MDNREHPFITLARDAIRHYLDTRRSLRLQPAADDPPPCGVFVSLHEGPAAGSAEGPLRGCIGTIHPRESNLRTEIARSAVALSLIHI